MKNNNSKGNEGKSEVKTEVKETAGIKKAYKVYHYSDKSTRSTQVASGRPRLKLENGAVLVKVVEHVPAIVNAKETVEVVDGLAARETLLTYSDGTVNKGGKGKRRQTLENGAKLVSVLVRIPKSAPKETKEEKNSGIKETIIPSATKKTIHVYADGYQHIASRGRPAPTRNGSPLVEIIRHVVAATAKDEVKRTNEIGEKRTVLVYSDGKHVVATGGRPAPKLNGATLVEVIYYSPTKRERKPKVVKTEETTKAPLTLPTAIPASIEVGKVYYHATNGTAIKVLELKNDTQIIGELLLDGKLTTGTILNSNLRS